METEPYFSLIIRSIPLFLQGMAMTLKIFLSASCLSLSFGSLLGIMTCNRLKIPFVSRGIELWTFVLRAIPFYVQLLLVYFVLPDLLGIDLGPFAASVIALGLCSSGYVAQIVRGGINLIPASQWESSFTLGFNRVRSLRYIILPQVSRQIIPMLSNEFESLLKSTSIVSSIGMLELTRVGMNIVSREMQPIAIYLTIAALYMSMSALLNGCTIALEKRSSRIKKIPC